ncbi:MAG: hypothetical protein HFJ40_07035 [Clostridia bacterium]|nr:hypothetical protein [Clostridia bacterium]
MIVWVGKKYENYYLNAYKNPHTFYEDIETCIKSEALYNFIINLRSRGIKMYCLSGMRFSFYLKTKQSFINKYYGDDIEVISTASQELKVDGIKIIQRLMIAISVIESNLKVIFDKTEKCLYNKDRK